MPVPPLASMVHKINSCLNLDFNAKQPNKTEKVQAAVMMILSCSSAFWLTTETVKIVDSS